MELSDTDRKMLLDLAAQVRYFYDIDTTDCFFESADRGADLADAVQSVLGRLVEKTESLVAPNCSVCNTPTQDTSFTTPAGVRHEWKCAMGCSSKKLDGF